MITQLKSETWGGFAEAGILYPHALEVFQQAQRLWLLDGSSPVPNTRANELVMCIWGLLHGKTEIVVDICYSGTITEYARPLFGSQYTPNEEKYEEWKNLFGGAKRSVLSKDRMRDYAPLAILHEADQMAPLRLAAIEKLSSLLLPSHDLHIQKYLDMQVFQKVGTLSLRATNIGKDKVIGTFACPECSYQAKEPVYHALRGSDMERCFYISSATTTKIARCHSTQYLSEIISADTTLAWLISKIGFKVYGKAAFRCITDFIHKNGTPTLLGIRDYSDPRGSITAVQEWYPDMFVTPRLYIRDKEGADLSAEECIQRLQACPDHCTTVGNFLKEYAPVSDGRVVTMTL
jgi:hypothetical protein